MEWIADDDVQSEKQHLALISQGVAFVAEGQGHGIVGFLNGEVTPDALHIWQMAVHHQQQGRGIGRHLIEAAQQHAVSTGIHALTLTTFRDVAWNEPYYQRLGHRTLGCESLDPPRYSSTV
ncbi:MULTISPECIES: GNAT family N-acetyltransferase [Rhizobium]|uniref:GNAT family N-acetyltransferase n=1 Tax=Rhizobium TaxID=379 RepID=UPI001389D15B|nr:GNAT family N-acetyltransferase [Rhizobium leguminosarum]NDK53551.1 GNAT family N-acetyltransferase [Rhizobium laguerreae]